MSDLGLLVTEDYLEKDYFIETEEQEAAEAKAAKKIKIIKFVFCILCVLLIGELIAYKYVMPSFSSPKVTVAGQKNYSAEEVASLLLPMNSTNWFDFDVNQAAAILSSEAGIESVKIEKKFPDKIYINVEEEPQLLLLSLWKMAVHQQFKLIKMEFYFQEKKILL